MVRRDTVMAQQAVPHPFDVGVERKDPQARIRQKSKSHLRQALEGFLGTVPPNAPIRRAFDSREIENQIAAFDAADSLALSKQRTYRRLGRLALRSATIGVLTGSLVLLPLDYWIDGWPRRMIEAIQAIAVLVSVATVICIALAKPCDRWMRARGEAERLRAEVFRDIRHVDMGVDRALFLRQALDCFVKAQLQSQLAYLAERGAQHRKAASALTPIRILGYLLSAGSVLIGLALLSKLAAEFNLPLPPMIGTAAEWLLLPESGRWQLGLGTIASSVLAYASARSLMDQDDRNASSYLATAALVGELSRTELSDAQAAADAGDSAKVEAFCEKVQTLLSIEHLAWTLRQPPTDPNSYRQDLVGLK